MGLYTRVCVSILRTSRCGVATSSLFVLNKAYVGFGLALCNLRALQESEKITAQVAALETNRTEWLARIEALESYERDLPN